MQPRVHGSSVDPVMRLAELIISMDFGEPAFHVCSVLMRFGRASLADLREQLRRRFDVSADAADLRALMAHLIVHRVVRAEERVLSQSAVAAAGAVAAASAAAGAFRDPSAATSAATSAPGASPARKRARPASRTAAAAAAAAASAAAAARVVTQYGCDVDAVLRRVRYPRFIDDVQEAYGGAFPAAGLVLRSLLYRGVSTAADLEEHVLRSVPDVAAAGDSRAALAGLVRVGVVAPCEAVPTLESDETRKVDVPRVSRRQMQSKLLEMHRGRPLVKPRDPRAESFYDVDFFRLAHIGRTNAISAAVALRYPAMEPFCGLLVKHVLERVPPPRDEYAVDAEAPPTEVVLSVPEVARSLAEALSPAQRAQLVERRLSFGLQARSGGDGSPVSEAAHVLESLLVQLAGDRIVQFKNCGPQSFSVDLGMIVAALQMQLVEGCLIESFGEKSLRVFRALVREKFLEFKAVSDVTLIDLKESKQILYRCYSEGFIQVAEISRTQERTASKSSYLWTVRFPDTLRSLLLRSYKVLYNLHLKVQQIEAVAETHPDAMVSLEALCSAILECDRSLERIGDTSSPMFSSSNPLTSAVREVEVLPPEPKPRRRIADERSKRKDSMFYDD
jgi:hypothetical protein